MEPGGSGNGTKPKTVLFVCMGNICRSPLAEGILHRLVGEAGLEGLVEIDSAGTGSWHQGEAPDIRSVETARSHGIDISAQRARQVDSADYDRFDIILAMDRSNEATLKARAPSSRHDRIHLFVERTLSRRADVPDPYYGGADGFEEVYELLREGCSALAGELSAALRQPNE